MTISLAKRNRYDNISAMSDRATPETDAEAFDPASSDEGWDNPNPLGRCVPADFARRMEHERDEWRECAEDLAQWTPLGKPRQRYDELKARTT